MQSANEIKLRRRLKTLQDQAEKQKKILDKMTPGGLGHVNARGRYRATMVDVELVQRLLDAELEK